MHGEKVLYKVIRALIHICMLKLLPNWSQKLTCMINPKRTHSTFLVIPGAFLSLRIIRNIHIIGWMLSVVWIPSRISHSLYIPTSTSIHIYNIIVIDSRVPLADTHTHTLNMHTRIAYIRYIRAREYISKGPPFQCTNKSLPPRSLL